MPPVGATVLPPRPPGGASGSACHHPSKRRFAEAFGGAHGEGVQCAEEISSNDSQDEDGVCTAWESSSDGEVDGLAPTTPTIPRDLGSAPAILNDLPCAFRWAFRLLLALSAVFGERQMRAQLCGSPLLMRTHFSGLWTAEVAIDALGRAARHFLPKPIRLSSASMCEKTHSLRQTIRRRRPEACVFGNICDLFEGIDQNLAEKDWDIVRARVAAARFVGHAPCSAHNGCWCPVARFDVDVSGSPCPPWSAANRSKHRRRRRHPSAMFLLVWCAMMRQQRPSLAVHENVYGIDIAIFREELGDAYDVHMLPVRPSQASFGFVSRPRVYLILVLRSVRRVVGDLRVLYAQVCEQMRCVGGSTAWLFRATPGEILEEETRHRLPSSGLHRVGAGFCRRSALPPWVPQFTGTSRRPPRWRRT